VQEVERSAGSVEEAVEAALSELGASEQEVDVEVVQEPRSGFLGVGAQPAVVRVRRIEGSQESAEPDPELEEQVELAADFVEGLLDAMDVSADVDMNVVEGTQYVEIWGAESDEGMGLLIGRKGQTVDALQELTRAVVQSRIEGRSRVVVDVEDYRKRRRSQLVSKATSAAQRVRRTGRPERMEPMNAFERKIVHDAVAGVSGVESGSEGEEPERRVVIRRH